MAILFEVTDFTEVTEEGPRSTLVEMSSDYEEAVKAQEALEAPRGGYLKFPDNTSSWGPFFVAKNSVSFGPFALAPAWGKEIESPWRRGVGVAVRTRRWSRVVGVWFKGSEPEPMPEVEEIDPADLYVTPGDLL